MKQVFDSEIRSFDGVYPEHKPNGLPCLRLAGAGRTGDKENRRKTVFFIVWVRGDLMFLYYSYFYEKSLDRT
jgi:hypothetical protein